MPPSFAARKAQDGGALLAWIKQANLRQRGADLISAKTGFPADQLRATLLKALTGM